MVIKETRSDKIFNFINYFLLACVFLICLYPLWFIIIASISNPDLVNGGQVWFWPKDISFDGYKSLFADDGVMRGYVNTLIYTTGGTLINLAVTLPAAYALSRRDFVGRKFFTLMFLFTMFFSGGLIPSYLLMGNLHLMNTYASMILPGLVGTYNMILIRNYFQSIPQDLEDACMIDGAGQFTTFYKIIIPVSTPILATVALWLAVGHWNSWFDVLLYMRNEERMTLQIILRRIVLEGTQQLLDMSSNSTLDDTQVVSSDGLKAATIYVATLPILLVYPFVQKYFVKGIMVGSVKG